MMVPSHAAQAEIPTGIGALGEYPGYYCYDANRPSWLPYFLDSVTESECKWSPKTIAGNIYHCVTGAPDCEVPSVAQENPALSGPGVAKSGEQSNTPQCEGMLQTYDPAKNACVFNPMSPALLIGAAAVLGIVLLVRR